MAINAYLVTTGTATYNPVLSDAINGGGRPMIFGLNIYFAFVDRFNALIMVAKNTLAGAISGTIAWTLFTSTINIQTIGSGVSDISRQTISAVQTGTNVRIFYREPAGGFLSVVDFSTTTDTFGIGITSGIRAFTMDPGTTTDSLNPYDPLLADIRSNGDSIIAFSGEQHATNGNLYWAKYTSGGVFSGPFSILASVGFLRSIRISSTDRIHFFYDALDSVRYRQVNALDSLQNEVAIFFANTLPATEGVPMVFDDSGVETISIGFGYSPGLFAQNLRFAFAAADVNVPTWTVQQFDAWSSGDPGGHSNTPQPIAAVRGANAYFGYQLIGFSNPLHDVRVFRHCKELSGSTWNSRTQIYDYSATIPATDIRTTATLVGNTTLYWLLSSSSLSGGFGSYEIYFTVTDIPADTCSGGAAEYYMTSC